MVAPPPGGQRGPARLRRDRPRCRARVPAGRAAPRRAAARTLRVGDDFDLVVLGIGLGAVPHVCRELVARDPRWRAMTERVTTVATQAFQLWLRADLAELGWPGPSPTLSGFVKPFDTWADMPHLIDVEAWRHPPRSIAYFCGALPLPPGAPGTR